MEHDIEFVDDNIIKWVSELETVDFKKSSGVKRILRRLSWEEVVIGMGTSG